MLRSTHLRQQRLSVWRARLTDWRYWLLLVLISQYAIVQLITGVEYGDAPRNLHWGLYVLQQPRFLLDVEDAYGRVNGFPPAPPSLAPAKKASSDGAPLHPWWGPLYVLIFAGIWWLTCSYTLLQLVVPVAAGGVVMLTYFFGKHFFGQPTGLLAATLLALFPLYREHAVVSFAETISALLLMSALSALLLKRTWLAALLGSLTVLGKIDLILLYFGTILLAILLNRPDQDSPLTWRRILPCLIIPVAVLLPWIVLVYGFYHRPVTVAGGPNLSIFRTLAPMMLDQFFTLPAFITLTTLGVLGGILCWSVRVSAPVPTGVYRTLLIWLALGCGVLLVYTATPGASNNPRVIIPALPPFCLIVAYGLTHMLPRWRMVLLTYLLTVFMLANAVGLLYQVVEAELQRATMPVWAALRGQPKGYVLTEYYWFAILYGDQPATWFESDMVFQNNILHHLDYFKRYLASAPIRYIVLPRDESEDAARLNTPAIHLYEQLPFGRDLALQPHLTSLDVRGYLEAHWLQQSVGDFVIFTRP